MLFKMNAFRVTCIVFILKLAVIDVFALDSAYKQVVYSDLVKDSFEVYVDTSPNFKSDGRASVVFYLDANLALGEEVRRRIDSTKTNTLFVGVGHIGNYRKLRRRDFIPPKLMNGEWQQSADKNFGQAANFYKFMKEELMPFINVRYPNNGEYSLIGHSLSGLFVYYTLLQGTPLFKNYVALSPSLWVNHSNIFEYENQFFETHKTLDNLTLYHAWGGLERFNKIRFTSRRMNIVLYERKYFGLNYKFRELAWKGHNGSAGPALSYIFEEVDF
jgi:predicted alpha/beta superfamily hydrolase